MTALIPRVPARYTTRTCRACSGGLGTILNLGLLTLSAFPAVGDPPSPAAPLDWCRCLACGLVQLRHTVDPDQLYREHSYWYRSGVNETMQAELADVVQEALARLPDRLRSSTDLVIDVGANDGTLLAAYRRSSRGASVTRIAFEPATACHAALQPRCEVLLPEYFPAGLRQLHRPWGHVQILTSIACFYGQDDPGSFVRHVRELLAPHGLWILQFQDLDQMVRTGALDNICHEHLFYPSLAAIERLVAPCGLQVIDASLRRINGGSYRLTIAKIGAFVVGTRVEALRRREEGCESLARLLPFVDRAIETRGHLRATVHGLQAQGRSVDLYAASTKANTLLQYCDLGPEAIRQAWERTPEKVGRLTATGIPIVSEETGRADPPAALLLGAWQFKDAFVQREAAYLRAGGSLIVPLPRCEIVLGAPGGSAASPSEPGYGHGV